MHPSPGGHRLDTDNFSILRVRLQTQSSVSFFCLTELQGANSATSSQPIICVPNRTHRVFFSELTEFATELSESGTKKEPKPKLLSPDIFWWGGGLPREGVGAKKIGMSLETQGIKLFWRDIPGFCRDIPEAPEKFEKKKMFGFNFWPLVSSLSFFLRNSTLKTVFRPFPNIRQHCIATKFGRSHHTLAKVSTNLVVLVVFPEDRKR